VFQTVVLLIGVAWVGAVTGDTVTWAVRWLVLSVFPAAVLGIMTRPAVRTAFRRGPAVGSQP